MTISAVVAQSMDGPLTPEQSLRAFKVEPGLRVELVAAEPAVIDPVALAFDEEGRMYVAEDAGYPVGPGKGKPPAGRIVLLEDVDRDGRYEKRTVYADQLTFPNGVMPWKGGLYVTCAPDLFYFKDTDGDGKADVKKVVFTGFQALSTTQLRISHPTLNIDNWIYVNSGLTASKVVSPDCKKNPLQINRLDFRFRPDTCEYEEVSGTGQFGGTFDKFGRRFICSNRNHNQHVVLPGRYLRRNPKLAFSESVQDTPEHGAACKVFPLSHNITTAASHTGYFTSACGLTIYEGTALPEEYRGNSFTCEPAGNLVHRDILQAKGATFQAKRAFATNEFLASPDNWFRPVNLTTGPDGALYLCDMYRKTIEHPDYLPEATRKITDFESGKDKGRIYRIVAKNHRTGPVELNFAKASTKDLCNALNHSNAWHRMTAHRLLLERHPSDASIRLKRLSASARTPETRVHALRLLKAFNALEDSNIERALTDKDPAVREHAVQLAEERLAAAPELVARMLTLAGDTDARVRYQVALSLGEAKTEKAVPALVKIALADSHDRWSRVAVMSSLGDFAEDFLEQVVPAVSKIASGGAKNIDPLLPLLTDLGRSLDASANSETAILRSISRFTNSYDDVWQIALLDGYASAVASDGTGSTSIGAIAQAHSSPPVKSRIEELTKRAGHVASDSSQSLERRLACVSLLSQDIDPAASSTLAKLVDPQHPAEIQIAAVRALTRLSNREAAVALLRPDRWAGYTQSVKDVVLTSMASQPRWLDALLSAIESGNIDPASINPEKRAAMMRHKDESLKKRAAALFTKIKPSDRMNVYEDHKQVLALKGNSKNGHGVFTRSCTPCHKFGAEGYLVGPDLTGIRSQPADVVLLHILVPEFEMMPIYTQYNVETKDGQSFSGILAAETPASVTLKQALGIEQTIPRSNIASMNSSTLSLMPQELEKTMTRQELADLIAFLKGE